MLRVRWRATFVICLSIVVAACGLDDLKFDLPLMCEEVVVDSSAKCLAECGDAIVAVMEACDDGNVYSGDGCAVDCNVEPGYICAGEPSVCATVCGDGVVTGAEACDDANSEAEDGCSSGCQLEHGYMCTGEPSACGVVCGDGVIIGTESCDDGNPEGGDGCSATCHLESGYLCEGEPSVCSYCGDGIVALHELCDDGNSIDGDGCSAFCMTEPYFRCGGAPSVCERISILFAPSHLDEIQFRGDVAAITGGVVDYFDARLAVPESSYLSQYDCVFTYVNAPYFDRELFGDRLADFVDAGGVVVLGAFATYTQGSYLSGRIMVDGYSPAASPNGANHHMTSLYVGGGSTFIYYEVSSYSCQFRDYLMLQGSGLVAGNYDDGEIAVAYRPDFGVIYANGVGLGGCGGDYPRLISNSCAARYSELLR